MMSKEEQDDLRRAYQHAGPGETYEQYLQNVATTQEVPVMDQTVYMNSVTDVQRERLSEISEWRRQSFPNGSDYRQQVLREGDYGDVVIQTVYNCGCYCRFSAEPGIVRVVGFGHVSIGTGADFGIYYCTRDQALTALR